MLPNLNIKQIWGKILTRLREINEAALFVSCGEVVNTVLKGDMLIAQTEKKYIYDLISQEQNILTIKRVMRFLGHDLDFKIEHVEGRNDKMEKDIEFLKQKLGNYLKLN